ncbi:6116_t:CDS:2 [Cetraspora pellucida]|uniref:6116_t:CDS:1 n=1 Tax=Cetraspora pellucida TaxID=1433469 RepID=A0ACA9JZ82_9GLOM|nr:6116_t:CDS:2 [Cetraspora pellucida]
MTEFYDFQINDIKKKPFDFKELKGKVVLIVNVASKCGFTKQYTGLEQLYQEFKNQDFVIIGFPCNQFGMQEPGTEEEIESFCRVNKYQVTFPLFSKIEVNGAKAEPLYEFLKNNAPETMNDPDKKDVKWNFTKFLVNRQGKVVHRYEPDITPESIRGEKRVKDR